MKVSKRMKKNLLIGVAASLVTVLLGGFLSLFSQSDDFYSCGITKWIVDAELKDNGDLYVTDTITFESDGYTFFEYEIGYGKNIIEGTGTNSYFDYDSIKVSVYDDYGHYYFLDRSEATSNSSSYFKNADCLGFSWNPRDCENEGSLLSSYTQNQDKELIYVYLHNGLGSVINFKYQYVIKNALNKYQDVSELNWQFATPLEEMKIENIYLNLTLPSTCSNYQTSTSWEEEGILAFGHGNGSSEFISFTSSKIETKTEKLNGKINDVLELRVVIPNSPYDCFSNVDTNNIISASKTGKSILENEENRLTNLDLENTNMYYSAMRRFVTINVVSILIVLGAIYLVYLKFDKERKPIFDSEYLRESPSKIIPSELSYLMNEKNISTEAFTANMISLIRKKYIEVDSNGSLLTDEKANYRLRKSNENVFKEEMNFDEEFVYNLLFKKLFPSGDFTMEEFEGKMKIESNALVYTNSIQDWQKSAYKRGEKLHYYDNITVSGAFSVLGILIILFAVYSISDLLLLYYLPTALILLSGLLLGISTFLTIYASNITRKSKVGIEEYTKWNAFKKFLCDFSHFEDYDIMSVIMWEEYLVYANVLGVADLVEKQMRIKLKDLPEESSLEYMDSTDRFYLYLHMNRINRRMVYYSKVAQITIATEKAKRAANTAGKVARSGGFGGSSSSGGGGHGGRAG